MKDEIDLEVRRLSRRGFVTMGLAAAAGLGAYKWLRDLVEDIPNAWALYWANPREEGCADEARRFLAHPKFLGVKMHPLLDSYHPNDPIVHPVARLLV